MVFEARNVGDHDRNYGYWGDSEEGMEKCTLVGGCIGHFNSSLNKEINGLFTVPAQTEWTTYKVCLPVCASVCVCVCPRVLLLPSCTYVRASLRTRSEHSQWLLFATHNSFVHVFHPINNRCH